MTVDCVGDCCVNKRNFVEGFRWMGRNFVMEKSEICETKTESQNFAPKDSENLDLLNDRYVEWRHVPRHKISKFVCHAFHTILLHFFLSFVFFLLLPRTSLIHASRTQNDESQREGKRVDVPCISCFPLSHHNVVTTMTWIRILLYVVFL